MTQPFLLKITNGTETADFISAEFKLVDGGFDVGTPEVQRSMYEYLMDRMIPVMENYGPRAATIEFEAHGATRADVLASIQKIERIVLFANEQFYFNKRVELQWAWEGSTDITYFEILSGDPVLSPDTMSVEKMHETRDGNIVLGGLRLSLQLSPFGYNVSPVSGSMTEIPLKNALQPSKATGGCPINFPWESQTNYVEVEAADVPGGGRLLTRIEASSGSPYEIWNQMFIGHRVSPFPTGALLFEGENAGIGTHGAGSSNQSHPNASNNSYKQLSVGPASPFLATVFKTYYWTLDKQQIGTFLAFAHFFDSPDNALWFTAGQTFYTDENRNSVNKWRKVVPGDTALPLGIIQNPPDFRSLNALGDGDQYGYLFSFHHGHDTLSGSENINLDFTYLLPVDHGLRVWVSRGSTTDASRTGKFVDDGFLGLNYIKRSDNNLLQTNWFTLYDPIRLYPNRDQRLYFNAIGSPSAPEDMGLSDMDVKIFIASANLTMAL